MKSKISVGQRSHFVQQILKAGLMAVIVVFVLSSDSLAQGSLPFIGTRTFCGDQGGTSAIISIRNDGFTTVKTNMYGREIGDSGTYSFETFSGKLNAKGVLKDLTVWSPREITMEGGQDYITGKLCTAQEINSVAFSPDGQTIAGGISDKTIKLWEVATGRELTTLRGHSSVVLTVAFSPDGRTLASGSTDNTVKVWDIASGREIKTFANRAGSVNQVAFSPNGKMLVVVGDDGSVETCDPSHDHDLEILGVHNGETSSVAFSPDGKMLVSGNRCLRCTGTGEPMSREPVQQRLESTLKLWDIASRKELTIFRPTSQLVMSVAFSPDGTILATGNWNNTINLWNVASRKELKVLRGHVGHVYSVAFSADSKTLASGAADNTVKLWDVASGQELRTLKGHQDTVTSVAFNVDGETLASASDDNTIKLWNVASGQELKTLGVIPKENKDGRLVPSATPVSKPPVMKNEISGAIADKNRVTPGIPIKPPAITRSPLTIDEAKSRLEQLQSKLLGIEKETRRETQKEYEKGQLTDQIAERIRAKNEARKRSLNRAMNQILTMEFTLPIGARLGPYDNESQRFSLQIPPNYQESLFVPSLEAKELKENFAQAGKTGAFGLHLDAQNRAKEYLLSGNISYLDKVYRIGKGEMSIARAMFVLYGNNNAATNRALWRGEPESMDDIDAEPEYSSFEAIPIIGKPFVENNVSKFMLVTGSVAEGEKEFGDGCHACGVRIGAAVFAKQDNTWKLELGQKQIAIYGAFGAAPDADLVKIGPERYALTFKWGDMHEGVTDSTVCYVDRVNSAFKEILMVSEGHDTSGYGTFKAAADNETYESKIDYIQGNNPLYFDIRLTKKGKRGAKVGKRLIMRPFTEIKVYKFSDGCYKVPGEPSTCGIEEAADNF